MRTPWHCTAWAFPWMASDTLYDAFNRLIRYFRLISTAGEVNLEKQGDRYELWFKLPAPKGVAAPASLDAALALFIQLCRFTKGNDFSPTEVQLHRFPPPDVSAFETFFNCPVHFDSDENKLYFEASMLETPLPGGQS